MKIPEKPRWSGLTLSAAIIILFCISCQKSDKPQKFDDVFDISGIKNLSARIDTTKTVAALDKLFDGTDIKIPADLTASKIEEMYTFLEKNIQLSEAETDKLLHNDPNTLLQVLERFGNLPPEFGDKNMNLDQLGTSAMSKYLLVKKEEPGINYYPEDYFSAVQAYRGFIEKCIIQPMKKIHTVVLHDTSELPHGSHYMYFVIISINNNWVMWWSYWWYGNTIYKIKHKGGSGSWPR